MDAWGLYGMGLEQYEKGNYSEAILYFEQSNAVEEHFKTYERLYRCWKNVGNKEKEISRIEKAYELNPRNDKTAFEYAEFQAVIGNVELARKVLKELIERNPSYNKVRDMLEKL